VGKIEQLMRGTDGLVRWYLSAIDELAQEGLVGICSIHGLNWCEVDNHADLDHAGCMVASWQCKQPAADAPGQKSAIRHPARLRQE